MPSPIRCIPRSARPLVASILLVLLAPAAPGAGATGKILLADPAETFGCRHAAGTFLVVLEPDVGVVVLSPGEFPGSRPAGSLEPGRLRVDLPGFAREAVLATGGVAGPLHGRIDRTLDLGGRRGCAAFDHERFTSEGDLATYVRWVVDELVLDLPAETWAATRSLVLDDRPVELEVIVEGGTPALLRTRQAAAIAFDLPGPEEQGRLVLLPVVLDEASGTVAVKVQAATGPYFEAGPKPDLGFVVLAGGEAEALLVEPMVAVRARSIGSEL